MKAPEKYGSNKDKYAKSVQGNLTTDEIIVFDWERSYTKKSGLTVDDLRQSVIDHVQNGGDVYRIRNTLFLISPQDGDYTEVKFHTLTADPREVYIPLMLLFFIGLNKTNGTEVAYTYSPSKAIYRMFKHMLGSYMEIEDVKDDPNADAPYMITVDVGAFIDNLPKGQQNVAGGAYGAG